MREGSEKGVVLAAMLFFTFAALTAYGQDPPLKVEIKMTHAVAKNAQDFEVSTKLENVGKQDRRIIHTSECSSSQDWPAQWTADNPTVHVSQPVDVRHISCKENSVIDIWLKPGEPYERTLSVRISLPASELRPPSAVSFRLGFSPQGEVILTGPSTILPPPSAPVRPIWSNAVTVNITE